MDPLVSIGLPTYNRVSYLKEALDSLLGQTHRRIEVIISDNASQDATERVCREYAKRDARIRYYRQSKNAGEINNFNFVLQHAQGEYFMWAADDDLWDAQFVEKLLEGFTDESVAAVFCRRVAFESRGQRTVLEVPKLSASASHFRNVLRFLFRSQSNLIYGIFRADVRDTLQMSPFDWCDVFLLNRLLMNYKYNIVDGMFFTARDMTNGAKKKSLATGNFSHFQYGPYFQNTVSALLKTKKIPAVGKGALLPLITLQVCFLFFTNEIAVLLGRNRVHSVQ